MECSKFVPAMKFLIRQLYTVFLSDFPDLRISGSYHSRSADIEDSPYLILVIRYEFLYLAVCARQVNGIAQKKCIRFFCQGSGDILCLNGQFFGNSISEFFSCFPFW